MSTANHFDVVIIGAGISGLGAACHLKRECPEKSFVILEGRDSIGGTWDLFRYPGIRSDSDLYTFGYDFKPWHGQPIATAEQILGYLHEVVEENDLASHIRYKHWIDQAAWNSEDSCWTLSAASDGEPSITTGQFLFMCQGYYNYEAGYRPEFAGESDFEGKIIHPQEWPEDLDYSNKNMVVIGSGATAATILPAVADKVASVTQLQRSPTYYLTMDNVNEPPLIEELRALDLPDDWIHGIKKRIHLESGRELAERSRTEPEVLKAELIELAQEELPDGFDVATHFTPHYSPWDERLCMLPDADMFKAIKSGKAHMVTDEIEAFVADGIRLKSGDVLPADIVVTATGIELCGLGNIKFLVDDQAVDISEKWTYQGIMLSDVPNMAWSFGYIRSSWTLRADMIARYVCRLLNHMDKVGATQCTPQLRDEDKAMNAKDFIDQDNFAPGYMQRGMHRLPQQGDHAPWRNCQNYYQEKDTMPLLQFDDSALVFSYAETSSESRTG
jgi:cation diffusion facilitator CzcD-associated flavoprotein CzcO